MAQNIQYSPAVPFVGPIVGHLSPGRIISVRGNIHPSCNRFALNLQTGPNVYPRDDVALHIGVDFVRGCITRNTIINMNWGPEESQGYFPFVKGSPFDISICCEAMHFKITVNGQYFATFEHRIVFHRVSHLTVDGEVSLSTIEYSGMNPSNPYPSGPYPAQTPYSPHSTPYPPQPAPMGMPYPQQPSMPHGAAPAYGPHGYPTSNSSGLGGLMNKAGAAVAGLTAAAGLGHLAGRGHGHGHGHGHGKHGNKNYILPAVGAGLAGAALTGHLKPKKLMKSQKKAAKKALKYGVPIAGVGLGAYAIHKTFRHSSSSSSSSSSSD